ncbi:MAG TPA: phosphate ABC transporter permease PstA [Erysipelothrix sp.]|nr:phosphate ABC transporter permease PstA [Erysipelothrix sp.]
MTNKKLIDFSKNRQKRKRKDFISNLLTYLAAGLATAVLVSIFIFVLQRGSKVLSWQMIRDDYWSQNFLAAIDETDAQAGNFERPADLDSSIYYSERFGIGVTDRVNQQKQSLVEIHYVHPDSPINQAIITTPGEYFEQSIGDMLEKNITRMSIVDQQGATMNIGTQVQDDASSFIIKLDSATQINTIFYQTAGGGIWGSLRATLILIGISLLIALPIGIAAAVYLHEYAKPNKATAFMRSSIEMLSGVPSIIFGLMGVAVLFPITTVFGANSLSILLGGITMAVMLLPIIIRQTEESLIVVPNGLRNASLSLGATETQTIFKVVLPTALPGIISAVLLAVSRVIGESAALIYTMGTAISDNPKLLQGATSLAVQIWSIMSGEQPNFELASAISIIILVVVLGLNLTVKVITGRLNRKWKV